MMRTLQSDSLNKDTFHLFKQLTQSIIEGREKDSQKHGGFLQMMMEVQATQSTDFMEEKPDTQKKLYDVDSQVESAKETGAKDLTKDEAMAQCVLFYGAGQDSAATAVAFASYLLAMHPEVQSKLRKEADDCFEKHGPCPSYDDISKLSYLSAVVSETLRLYPLGARLQRTPCQSDYVLGDTEVKVIKGGTIIIPVYAMHRDPEFFPDPDTFNPERFNEENIGSIRPYTYLPFGAGPRNCIGMRLALQIVKTALLYAVHSVEFVRTSETKVPLEFPAGFGTLGPEDITLGIRNIRYQAQEEPVAK